MLRLPVPPEVHLPLEAFSTQVAAEGLEACVLAAVGDEVGALAEGLPTHLALVWLLTCGAAETGSGSPGARCPAFVLWDFIMFNLTFAFENY